MDQMCIPYSIWRMQENLLNVNAPNDGQNIDESLLTLMSVELSE